MSDSAPSYGSVLESKRVLLVGGGRGIGRATSLAVAAAGAKIVVADNDAALAEEVASEIRAAGGRATAHVVDVRSDDAVEAMIDAAAEALGSVDVLITVVGGQGAFAPFQPLHETPVDTIDLIHGVNLRYVLVAVRAAVRQMLTQPAGGTIVSVGAISSVRAAPGHAAYGAAKAGLANLAQTVAVDYGANGIRMNVVAPGAIVTPAVAAMMPPDQISGLVGKVPLGRLGQPGDIAAAVVFLASPLSSYITGQQVVVDGGATLHYPFATTRPANPTKVEATSEGAS